MSFSHRVTIVILGLSLACMWPASAWAQPADAGVDLESILREERVFSINALPLEQAALRFSDQARVQLLMDAQVVAGLRSTPVHGRYRIDQALDLLLASSKLRWRRLGEHTVTIEPGAPHEAPEHLLSPVRIEAMQSKSQAVTQKSWDDAVLEKMDRHKRYPVEARRRGIQDVVYVHVIVDNQGHVLSSAIRRSRGFSELDQAVLDLIREIDPLPPRPASAAGKQYSFVVPVDFLLKER